MNISHSLQNNLQDSVTSAASITDVSRMVGLSRARFYQLIKAGVFPPPVYAIHSRRPYYTDQMQTVCVNIRKQNMGLNGQPILFYARKAPFAKKMKSSPRSSNKNKQPSRWNGILEGLKSLGLGGIESEQIEAIIRTNYPSGISDIAEGEVLRTCYRNLRQQKIRRNTDENVRSK